MINEKEFKLKSKCEKAKKVKEEQRRKRVEEV